MRAINGTIFTGVFLAAAAFQSGVQRDRARAHAIDCQTADILRDNQRRLDRLDRILALADAIDALDDDDD